MAIVKHQVGINGSLEAIYSCLTTNEGLSSWWASSASGNTADGETVDLTFVDLAVLRFRYGQLSNNHCVKLTCVDGPGPWQDSELLFELKLFEPKLYEPQPEEKQVFVTLTHQNKQCSQDDFLYFSTKWPVYLLSLKAFIETGDGRPYPRDIKIHLGD